jgi:hypothetical protein
MPERTSGRKVLTPTVQGADSWVIVRAATVGEILEARREQEQRTGFWYGLGVRLMRIVGWFRPAYNPGMSDQIRASAYRTINHIKAWNWVDEHGESLPQPSDSPQIVEQLTEEELACLIDAVYRNAQSEESKN